MEEFHNSTFPAITDVTKQQHCSPITRYADISTHGPSLGCVRKAAAYFHLTKTAEGCPDLYVKVGSKQKGPWYFNNTENAGQPLGKKEAAAHELALQGKARDCSLAEFDRIAVGIHKAHCSEGGLITCSCIGYSKISFCSHSLLCGEISKRHVYLATFKDSDPAVTPATGRPTKTKKGSTLQHSPNKGGPASAANAAAFVTARGLAMTGKPAKKAAPEIAKKQTSSSRRTLTPKKNFDPAVSASQPQWASASSNKRNRKLELDELV